MIIIIIFVKNNILCPKYIDIYEFWGVRGDVQGPPYIFCLLFKKMEKVQEHDLYLNQILHHFNFKKIHRMNNKNFTKGGPRDPALIYKVSLVVLIDFIAILLTPGIFLIQIVNTNMYLIHFHTNNIIKMCFSKVGF